MESVRIIALIIFGIVAFLLIVSSYFPIFKDVIRKRRSADHDSMISQELTILKSSSDSLVKAKAFVSLMNLSYVLVHTLVNKGNNYDDKTQSDKFHKFLTPQVMKKIFSMEGKYE